MKRIIVLLITLFIMTGCSAEYNLVYEDNVFEESLKVISTKEDSFVSEINNYYNRGIIADYTVQLGEMDEFEYISKYGGEYKKNIIDENNMYGLQLGYKYQKDEEYSNSSIVFNLFESIYIFDNKIEASNIRNIFNNYNNLSKITISFKTDKNVVNINSDEIKDNVYYWYINKDNYTNKQIEIELEEAGEELLDSDGYLTGNVIKYIIMFVVIMFLFSIIYVYEKIRKSNN